MSEKVLQIEFMPYPEKLLDAWENGHYSMLKNSKASGYIKEILVDRAERRPGRRFFGEAYIASKIEMKEGWYSSFKWLTSDKWISGEGLNEFEKLFHYALMKYVGTKALTDLQRKAVSLYEIHKEKLADGNKYNKPVAPDLWIIDQEDRFRFIEIKMPGDTIRPHQIAGLALIQRYLKVPNPVSVSIVTLYPENISYNF
jgi:hypothetical protein